MQQVKSFINTNWFNIVSVLIMLIGYVRMSTYNETTYKSFMVNTNTVIAELQKIVADVQHTVNFLDKNQAVDKECISRIEDDIRELKSERRMHYVNRSSGN